MNEPEDGHFVRALEYEGIVRAFLLRYVPNPAEVEELLQLTYSRLLAETESKAQRARSARAHALHLAREVALDWLRRLEVVPFDRIADLEALNVLDHDGQVQEIVSSHEELTRLVEGAARLPGPVRQVYTLRKVYGLSIEEIARKLRMSEQTVEQHLVEAVRQCANIVFDRMPETRRSALLQRMRRLSPDVERD